MIGNGCVIAIGGNENKRGSRESILAKFVGRAGGEESRIIVIPSASEFPERRVGTYSRLFRRFGAHDIRAVHAERGSVTHAEREAIRTASGIFVTGGSQVRLMAALHATDCVDAIRDAVRRGAVYAGTSAGASAASRTMIAGNEGDLVELGEGLGLIPDLIIDQHFGQRGRLARLQIAAKRKRMIGIGIDEDTAIVWNGSSGEVLVEGVGKVTVVDCVHKLHVLDRSMIASCVRPR